MKSNNFANLTYDIDNTIICKTTSDDYISVCDLLATYPEKKEEAPKDAKNLLVAKDKRIKVKNCKNGFVEATKDIMPDIKEVSVSADGVNSTVILVTFTDGTTEKAVLDPEDDFSLEHGLTIIMLEKLLSDMGVDGKSVHNKLVNHAIKFYKHQEDARIKAAELKKAEKEKKKRIEEKIRVRKAKKARAEREYQIEMHKEAYLRAMREIASKNI